MTHTPGPWKMRDAEVIIIGGGFDIGIVAEENGNVSLIAEVYEVVNQSGRKADVKANAALIEAAPDMLDALESIQSIIKVSDHRTMRTQLQMCRFFDELILPIIESAFAQVKGDQS
jgi:uncharacterized protein YqgV (UPF0045/DUF77 family)